MPEAAATAEVAAPTASATRPLLEVTRVSVRFGGVQALTDVDLEVAPGSVTGLIGPNGAGKTTLFNTVTGLQAPASGTVRLDGVDITSWPAHRRGRAGIARTFQRLELFTGLTVHDNLLGAWEATVPGAVLGRHRKRGREVVAEIEETLGLGRLAGRLAGQLSTGEGRVVELARALCAQPRLLLLDEPASGLDPGETEQLKHAVLASVRRAGGALAVLLVEHDVPLVMETCDRITVLDFGQRIASGTPDQVRTDPRVIAAYLGDPDAA